MRHFLLFAAGKDRPGIVAAVTGILYRRRCNLEDSAMTRLGSEFASLLIFKAPPKAGIGGLEDDLAELAERMGLILDLKPLEPAEAKTAKPKGTPYILSVYGADRPGIVHRVSRLLAAREVNITDVSTHRTGRGAAAGYVMLLEVELGSPRKAAAIERALKALAGRLKLNVSLRPVDVARI